jgi:hypothetical protein
LYTISEVMRWRWRSGIGNTAVFCIDIIDRVLANDGEQLPHDAK